MAGQARSAKDKQMASYLKERRVQRTTTACAHHCGAHPPMGPAFLAHLNMCRGRKRLGVDA